ncbi:MAG TPA: VWA domain-containing protein [Pyrinomonadaceae bacterium]
MTQGSAMIRNSFNKSTWLAFALAVLAIFLFAPVASAQGTKNLPAAPPPWKAKPTPTPKPAEPEVVDVIRTTSNLVMVPVSVTDSQGQAIQGLQVKDFRLDEEGKQQEIAEIGDPEQIPLDIAILFDTSSSVGSKGFFGFQQEAAAAFLKQVMKPVDRAAVFTIAMEPALLQPLASAQVAANSILAIQPPSKNVPTAFYDTVSSAATYLAEKSESRHRRVIVVISDGDDNFSQRTRDASLAQYRANTKGQAVSDASSRGILQDLHRLAVADIQQAVLKADATFYSVNPGGRSIQLNLIAVRAQNGMQTVAEATGGTAFVPDGEKDLEVVFRQVAAELRGQYLLQYYGDSEAPAGKFRRIVVTVPTQPQAKVRARQGYYPKKQKS